MKNKNSDWKWGIFYYNKDDDEIFPPKKNPAFGFTINFANPKSILAFLIMLGFFGFIIFIIERNQ